MTQFSDQIVSEILVVIRETVDIDDDIVNRIKPRLTGVISSLSDRFEDQQRRIEALERRQKAIVISERRREINQVRNSVILKTKKSVAEVQKFVASSIDLGGGGKIAQKNVHLAEIAAPVGKPRDQKVFRCVLGDKEKKGLFVGLSKIKPDTPAGTKDKPDTSAGSKDDRINVENETPRYLSGAKRELERISYSLRKAHKQTHQLKAKIILSNMKLKLKLKDSDNPQEWFGMEDSRAERYLSTPVHYRAEEMPRDGAKTCKEHYLGVLASLDF